MRIDKFTHCQAFFQVDNTHNEASCRHLWERRGKGCGGEAGRGFGYSEDRPFIPNPWQEVKFQGTQSVLGMPECSLPQQQWELPKMMPILLNGPSLWYGIMKESVVLWGALYDWASVVTPLHSSRANVWAPQCHSEKPRVLEDWALSGWLGDPGLTIASQVT